MFSCKICEIFENTYFEVHLQASVLNKVAGPKVCNLIKKRLQHRCFPVKFAKFLRAPISKNIYERLLLSIDLFPKGCIFCETLLYSEAATGSALQEKVFLEISQN